MKTPCKMIFMVVVGVAVSLSGLAEVNNPGEGLMIEQLASEHQFVGELANHDPFKPLVVKKVVEISKIERKAVEMPTEAVKKEVIVPLKLKVTGICGNDSNRQAVVECDNEEYLLAKGEEVAGKFKVVEVNNDKILVYSIRESRRAAFELSSN